LLKIKNKLRTIPISSEDQYLKFSISSCASTKSLYSLFNNQA